MDDGSAHSAIPIVIYASSSGVRRLQACSSIAVPAPFALFDSEKVTITIERTNDSDARVSHDLVLEYDDFFNNAKVLTLHYGRSTSPGSLGQSVAADIQQTSVAMLVERSFTPAIVSKVTYQSPKECEVRKYQLFGIETPTTPLSFNDALGFVQNVSAAAEIPIEQDAYRLSPQTLPGRQLFHHLKRVFYDDTLRVHA